MYPHGTSQEIAEEWLMEKGVLAWLSDTLRAVLIRLWTDGYTRGLGTSPAVVAVPVAVAQLGGPWLAQIARFSITLIAGALAAGVSVATALNSRNRAHTIAVTEFNRARSQAQMDAFLNEGVTHVRWVTSHDPDVCAHCKDNEDAGPWPLGVPFPSGAMCPPDHPNCRCHIEKVA